MTACAPASVRVVMAPISIADELEIQTQSRSIDFQCDDPSVPKGEENLVVRAARTFFAATKVTSGIAIELKKKIPHGAGLGGGSSDAASTLLVLNELFETKLPREALAKMAESIGSDVSFFIFQSAAICKGRGDQVTPIKLPERLSILLLKPEFGVLTEWAYRRWQHSHEIPEVDYSAQKFSGKLFVNDLERPVFEKFVFLARLKIVLLKQPEVGAALMSGSGSTMFAVLQPGTDVDVLTNRAKAKLDPQLWTCACKTLNVER
jgi:4-diphosphocytidyl-2-C-methyl-D-erythritol kinase